MNENQSMRYFKFGMPVATLISTLVLGTVVATAGFAATHGSLTEHGLGGARLGTAKTTAVAQLTSLLGQRTSSGINTGCGGRFTEVAWRDFIAEFRGARFTGYRYVHGGYPLRTRGSPRPAAAAVSPKLETTAGITLMTTLGVLRRRYRGLRHIGANKWRARNGLIFVDNAKRDPEPLSSRIIEIKFHTCGDF